MTCSQDIRKGKTRLLFILSWIEDNAYFILQLNVMQNSSVIKWILLHPAKNKHGFQKMAKYINKSRNLCEKKPTSRYVENTGLILLDMTIYWHKLRYLCNLISSQISSLFLVCQKCLDTYCLLYWSTQNATKVRDQIGTKKKQLSL